MKRLEITIILAILAVSAIIIYFFSNHGYYAESIKDYTYSIETNWELPAALNEVSGISWVKDSTIAAVQDEDGIIFHYNLHDMKITDTINFAEKGDYEGLAIKDSTAYIMRSDGLLYEVLNYTSKTEQSVKTYQTLFETKHNVESLAYDEDNNRLLIIAKDRDPKSKRNKGVYAFSLDSKIMAKNPIVTIDLKDESFSEFSKKKVQKTFRPSDIAIHPISKDFYVIEGVNPKLIILSPQGKVKKIQLLNPDDFQQPEGITFNKEGVLYISNEFHATDANILHVMLEEKTVKKDSIKN
jgi:uncharacterized protein YjiK